MATSIGLASLIFGLALLLAWSVWHFGRKADQSPLKLKALVVLFLVGGAASAWWAFETDAAMRRQTLFEVMADGSSGGQPGTDAPVRDLRFSVEHAGIAHDLLIAPVREGLGSVEGPVEIQVALRGPDGRSLIEETHRFETRSRNRSATEWDAWYTSFTPAATGEHRLTLTLLHVGIPKVHVHVSDPLKTDGQRIPGY